MPLASDPSSDSDSDSDELQRIKEAVFDVHQQQERPSNGIATAASKAQRAAAAGDANKSRERASAKSARYEDSDEERDDHGREFFSRDVQQFIAKKLTKFLDDTIESSTSFLTSGPVAGEDVGGEAEVSTFVKVFSCSTAPAIASPEVIAVEDAPTKGRRKKRPHSHRNEAHRTRGEVGLSGSTKAEEKRAISAGDTNSSNSSSGSEEEETRQLELSSVAVSAEDVHREKEVLHKHGVKRLGKLEVYRMRIPAPPAAPAAATAANAPPNCSCDRAKKKDRRDEVGKRKSGEANEKLRRTAEEAGTAANAVATVPASHPGGDATVKCGSGQRGDERPVGVNGRDDAVMSRRAKRRRHKKLNKEFI